MALIKCKECGKEISDQAKTCPSCGAKVKKPAGGAGKLLALIVLGSLLASTITTCQKSSEPEPTEAQKAATAAANAALARQTQLAVLAVATLKKSLRDPDSLVLNSVRVDDKTNVACIDYRAKNGFGGYNSNTIAFVDGVAKTDAAHWNKFCTKSLEDFTDTVNRQLR
jgi:hypothetical protein